MSERCNTPELQIVSRLKQHFEDLGLLTAKELSLGYGRADLVVFKIEPSKCMARFNNNQLRSLDRVEHYSILRLLPEITSGNAVSLEYLSEMLNFSKSHLRNELMSFLIRFGYVIEIKQNLYTKVNGFVPVSEEIWAIEAKIKDWRKGAIQAKRYQVFANRVFLALPLKYSHRVDINLLSNHNIGLLIVENEIIEKLSAPKLLPKDQDRFAFASEWLWRYKRRNLKEILTYASQ